MSFSANLNKPFCLVLFDYTEFSGYGTEFNCFLRKELFEPGQEFKNLPEELSALVYVERKIKFSTQRSAVYCNPFAKNPLPKGAFRFFKRFYSCSSEIESENQSPWIVLPNSGDSLLHS